MSIFDKLEETDMIAVIDREMAHLLKGVNDEKRQVPQGTNAVGDAESWFEIGLNDIDAGLRYESLAFEKARLLYAQEHPDVTDDEVVQVSVELPELADFYTHAVAAFDYVLRLEPDYYGVQCQRGIAFANMHDFDNAEAAFLQALNDDDEDFTAAYNLALAYRDTGRDDKAAEYFALAQKLNPEDEGCGCC